MRASNERVDMLSSPYAVEISQHLLTRLQRHPKTNNSFRMCKYFIRYHEYLESSLINQSHAGVSYANP